MNNIKAFLGRGTLAGVIGGVAAALFQWLVTEGQIRKALAIEAARAAGQVHDEMFSRTTQVLGGMAAAVLYGVFLGLVFAVVAAVLWATLPGRKAFHKSIRLATVGYVAWVLVPGLKYPANPPAVGSVDTVASRTTTFLGLIVASIIVAYLAWELWQRIGPNEHNPGRRFAIVAGVYLSAIAVIYVVLPSNQDPLDAPADLIWHFRLDSLAGNALLWLTMGTVFGILGDRIAPSQRRATRNVALPFR